MTQFVSALRNLQLTKCESLIFEFRGRVPAHRGITEAIHGGENEARAVSLVTRLPDRHG